MTLPARSPSEDGAWPIVERARHPRRPYALDLANCLFDEYIELAGDRLSGDDPALRGGFALLRGSTIVFLATQKGRTTADRVQRNFGMAHPEGYRKAVRLLRLAEKLGVPALCLVDTPGAYPGRGAEERGQAWAIADCLRTMLSVRVPTVAVIVGEGGSGGALALAAADRVLMLENSIYSVASPEACASIVFRSSSEKQRAAGALGLTAQHAMACGLVDRIIDEPEGGAHQSLSGTTSRLGEAIVAELTDLCNVSSTVRLARRLSRYCPSAVCAGA